MLHLNARDFCGLQSGNSWLMFMSVARGAYKGHLMVNMGYSPEEANQ